MKRAAHQHPVVSIVLWVSLSLLVTACPRVREPDLPPPGASPPPIAGEQDSPSGPIIVTGVGSNTPTQSPSGAVGRDAKVSASAGVDGGMVVLWPRVIPSTDDPGIRAVASALQVRMAELARSELPGAPLDIRPEPERVCPQGGCVGASFGVLLAHRDGACVAVAVVSRPGQAPGLLIPWGGRVKKAADEIPFREPPESHLKVTDFVPCDTLLVAMSELEPSVRAAVKAVGH